MYGQGSFNPQSGGQGSQTPIAPSYSHRPPPLPHNFQLGPPPHTGQPSLPPPQHLLAPGGTANAAQSCLHSSTTVRGIAPFQHVYAPAQHSSYLASGPPPPPPFGLHRLEMLQAPLPPRGLPPPPPPPPPSPASSSSSAATAAPTLYESHRRILCRQREKTAFIISSTFIVCHSNKDCPPHGSSMRHHIPPSSDSFRR